MLEGKSFGKKVLYANFTGKSDYHCDFDESIVFDHETNNDKKFYECLDKLRTMSDTDYANHIGGNSELLCARSAKDQHSVAN